MDPAAFKAFALAIGFTETTFKSLTGPQRIDLAAAFSGHRKADAAHREADAWAILVKADAALADTQRLALAKL